MSIESIFSYVLVLANVFLAAWTVLLVGASAVVFRES
jgi:hypothetical protein